MKQSLFVNHNFIRRKGSATVMALLFLLFFTIIGVAWAAMMNMEVTTSSADIDEQQAWYAAEAGVKRAQVEILNKNTNWSWLNEGTVEPKNFKLIGLESGTTSTETDKAKYGVQISYILKGSTGNPTYLTQSNQAIPLTVGTWIYTIKSIGKYKQSNRVLTKTYSITVTNS